MKNYSFDERVTLSTKWVTFAREKLERRKIVTPATSQNLHQLLAAPDS